MSVSAYWMVPCNLNFMVNWCVLNRNGMNGHVVLLPMVTKMVFTHLNHHIHVHNLQCIHCAKLHLLIIQENYHVHVHNEFTTPPWYPCHIGNDILHNLQIKPLLKDHMIIPLILCSPIATSTVIYTVYL